MVRAVCESRCSYYLVCVDVFVSFVMNDFSVRRFFFLYLVIEIFNIFLEKMWYVVLVVFSSIGLFVFVRFIFMSVFFFYGDIRKFCFFFCYLSLRFDNGFFWFYEN